ncbi:MAG: hypothetical protein Q9183_004980, partial [Haloplaca sp. 2 TL-2023]
MHFAEVLMVAATFYLLAAATPIELRPRNKNFIVHQQTRKPLKKSGPRAVLSTYAKYNVTAPEDVIRAAANNDGTVSATPEIFDSEYLTPVTIGGQVVNLDFDTGSSDLWCFSPQLTIAQINGHSIYDPLLSLTSYIMNGLTWGIIYGDSSSASGNVYGDYVTVGTTTVAGQAVELAQTISSEFVADINNDGLLGLGFDKINTVQPTQQKTFFSNAKVSLTSPLFTADLKRGRPGTYTFGYIDPSQHQGPITYAPVNAANGFWQFTSSGYAIGRNPFIPTEIISIADTGTSILYLPHSIVAAYYSQIDGAMYDPFQGGYTLPCYMKPPDFSLGIGKNYTAVVPGQYILYAPVN